MKRTFAVLSLALVMTLAAVAQTSSTGQAKAEQLNKKQLNALIATAKTPAEHERIAAYYQAKAVDYLDQSKEHEAMVAAYKANGSLSNDKNRASTIDHCQYFVTTFKALSDSSQDLAVMHERMASEATEKLPATGK
jgi:hypothetical protein